MKWRRKQKRVKVKSFHPKSCDFVLSTSAMSVFYTTKQQDSDTDKDLI